MKLLASLRDDQYPFTYTDHVRLIARGVVYNDKKEIALIKLHGQDKFGNRNYYELPGGGVKDTETNEEAFVREIIEEVGWKVKIIAELGEVDDFYNLIHRENHNFYFLGSCLSYVGTKLEDYEKAIMEKVIWVSIDEAIAIFKNMNNQGCATLVKRRELPILILAKQKMEEKQ